VKGYQILGENKRGCDVRSGSHLLYLLTSDEGSNICGFDEERLSREGVLETLQHLNRLTACGVGYKSFTEQYLDSCGIFKNAVIGILAVVAKQERVRLSERTKAGPGAVGVRFDGPLRSPEKLGILQTWIPDGGSSAT